MYKTAEELKLVYLFAADPYDSYADGEDECCEAQLFFVAKDAAGDIWIAETIGVGPSLDSEAYQDVYGDLWNRGDMELDWRRATEWDADHALVER